MFDLPEGKRVRRTDLISSQSSCEPSSPSSSLEGRFQEQLTGFYDVVSLDNQDGLGALDQPATGSAEAEAEAQNEDEYEFHLFAKPLDSTKPTTKTRVIVRSPTPTQGDPGFVKSRRFDAYYFTGNTGEVLREQYRSATVTGEQITRGLAVRWSGCELPWRVTTVRAANGEIPSISSGALEVESHSRRRSGKKSRIKLRKEFAAARENEAAAKQRQVVKDAEERDKRTRRNREKKVKKKQREKLKRVEGTAEPG